MPDPLTPPEIAIFHMLVRSAIVLLLLMRLERSANIQEIASLLGLHEQTVSRSLRQLIALGLVVRQEGRYLLSHAIISLLGGTWTSSAPTRFASTTTTTFTESEESESKVVVVVDPATAKRVNPLSSLAPSPPADPELLQALLEAGIGEPKRSTLAARPDLTPLAVRAWEMQLKREKAGRYSTGLLIYVLEKGDPPPPTQENGHLLDCTCEVCRRANSIICPDCYQYPCACEWEDD